MGGSNITFEEQIALDTTEELVQKLMVILKALDWNVMLPPDSNNEDIDMTGLIAGNANFIEGMMEILNTSDE